MAAGRTSDGFGAEQFGDRELKLARVCRHTDGQGQSFRLPVGQGQGCCGPDPDARKPTAADQGLAEAVGSSSGRSSGRVRR